MIQTGPWELYWGGVNIHAETVEIIITRPLMYGDVQGLITALQEWSARQTPRLTLEERLKKCEEGLAEFMRRVKAQNQHSHLYENGPINT